MPHTETVKVARGELPPLWFSKTQTVRSLSRSLLQAAGAVAEALAVVLFAMPVRVRPEQRSSPAVQTLVRLQVPKTVIK
jgi:hypothetical protein